MTGLTRPQLIAATAGVLMALLLASLDQTIVGTALPRIVAELNGLDRYSWLVTGYLVSTTVITPISGKLGDLFGRKPFLIVGILGFVSASAVCGLSQTMNELIVFRVVQGLFGGFLFSSAFTVLADLFTAEQRARMQGLFGAVFGLSSIVGPVVGGYLTDNFGWRWVFYVNLPIGLIGVLLVVLFLPFVRSKQATWRNIDFLGAISLAAGIIPLLVALSITRDHAWTSPEVAGLIAFSAVMLIAFYWVERHVGEPIVPFELFKNRVFAVAMLIGFLTALGMFGMIVFIPLELQGVLGASVTNSGLQLTPMMAGVIVASVVTGNLMVRIRRYRYLGTIGTLCMAIGIYLVAQTTYSTPQWHVTAAIVVVGLGLGVTFPLYINAVQAAVPQRFLGVASSQIQFWRQIGGTISTAVLGSILAVRLPGAIQEQLAKLNLPPGFRPAGSISGRNPNALLDPSAIAAARAKLPPNLAPVFDQVLIAVRNALAATLHDLFLVAVALALLAAIASVFMPEVPLRGRSRVAAEVAPPVPDAAAAEA